MSRRRKPRRTTRSIAGAESLNLVCSEGTRGTHTAYRIAEVTVYPNPESEGTAHLVRVRYVHPDDEHGEANNPARAAGADPHFTRRFVCRECGCDVPLKDENLAAVVLKLASLGVSKLELRRLTR